MVMQDYSGLLLHCIRGWPYNKGDSLDNLIGILVNGFHSKINPNNENAIPYKPNMWLFTWSEQSFYENFRGDKYSIVFDPPIEERFLCPGESSGFSIGNAEAETIKQVHVFVFNDSRFRDKAIEKYKTKLEQYLSKNHIELNLYFYMGNNLIIPL
jgi:hypothetical protein